MADELRRWLVELGLGIHAEDLVDVTGGPENLGILDTKLERLDDRGLRLLISLEAEVGPA